MIKEISSFSEVPVGGEAFVVYDANVAWIAEQIISRGAVGAVAVEATEESPATLADSPPRSISAGFRT